uniref:Uncharacterized protein n=1 Tax=Oryza nivara TaxID=4536 RepID=A0A0E0HCC5_ORYNI
MDVGGGRIRSATGKRCSWRWRLDHGDGGRREKCARRLNAEMRGIGDGDESAAAPEWFHLKPTHYNTRTDKNTPISTLLPPPSVTSGAGIAGARPARRAVACSSLGASAQATTLPSPAPARCGTPRPRRPPPRGSRSCRCATGGSAAEAVCSGGKVCMVNLRSRDAKERLVFDLRADRWKDMPPRMLAGWKGPTAASPPDNGETIYVLDEERGALTAYDWGTAR